MAIVANKANDGGPIPNYSAAVDRPLRTHNVANAGEPNGSVTPNFVGEICLDTTNNALWIAQTTANTGWVTLTTPA